MGETVNRLLLLTDVAGFLLLFPLTRYPIKAFIKRRAQSWVNNHQVRIEM